MQEGDARTGDMQDKDRKERNRKRGTDGDAPEIGVVRVFSNPGPAASPAVPDGPVRHP